MIFLPHSPALPTASFYMSLCWLKLQEPVKSEEGRDMANRISAFGYLECSAKTKDGVREVFEMATRAALQVRKRKKRGGCQLLWRNRVCWLTSTWGRTPPFTLREINCFCGLFLLHRCRYATEEYERLTHLFKSKTNQLFLKLYFLCYSHPVSFVSVLFFSTSLFASSYMNVCLYLCVHILYKYIKHLPLFYDCLQRKGVVANICPLSRSRRCKLQTVLVSL